MATHYALKDLRKDLQKVAKAADHPLEKLAYVRKNDVRAMHRTATIDASVYAESNRDYVRFHVHFTEGLDWGAVRRVRIMTQTSQHIANEDSNIYRCGHDQRAAFDFYTRMNAENVQGAFADFLVANEHEHKKLEARI